jgi:hypothetical protein
VRAPSVVSATHTGDEGWNGSFDTRATPSFFDTMSTASIVVEIPSDVEFTSLPR